MAEEYVITIGYDEVCRCTSLDEARERARDFAAMPLQQWSEFRFLDPDARPSDVSPLVEIWRAVDFDAEDPEDGPVDCIWLDVNES